MKTLNYSLMNADFLTLFNSCLDSIYCLALKEIALKEATEEARKTYSDKKDISKVTQSERTEVRNAKVKASDMCTLTLGRYIDISDMNDIYHFNMERFLTNIGVISGEGNLKKGALSKVETLRNSVTDRVRTSVTRRKKGDNFLTYAESKSIDNNSIDVILALRDAFILSNCYEMTSVGLVKKDFNKESNN